MASKGSYVEEIVQRNHVNKDTCLCFRKLADNCKIFGYLSVL